MVEHRKILRYAELFVLTKFDALHTYAVNAVIFFFGVQAKEQMFFQARKSNNHFGIKCGGDWNGRTVRHDDDARGECFRAYKHPKQSYEDHSKFLVCRPRYASLFKLKITDYKGWARGLKKAGYDLGKTEYTVDGAVKSILSYLSERGDG